MGLLIRSVFVGILSAVVTCVFAFALAPWFDAVGLLIAPAGVLLVLGSALFFWVVIFGAIYYILISCSAALRAEMLLNPSIKRDALKRAPYVKR